MRLPSDDDSPALVTATIPSVVDGTELVGEFAGSGYREPPHLVCRPDGQVVQLPAVLYLLVKVLDRQRRSVGKRLNKDDVLSQAADVLSKETGREFNGEHIAYLIDRKLAPLGVTTYTDGSVPDAGKAASVLSLRYRAAVFSEGFTSFLGGLFAWLYLPPVMLFALLAAVGTQIWVFATHDMGAVLQQVLLTPSGIVLIILLSIGSAAFHEIGHAAACRYAGVSPGTMGCGIYLVWPVFYTDVTNSYRLGRAGRLRTDLGGVYFNGLFVIGLVALYLHTGLEAFLVAVLATNLEIIRQLLPTFRFDGYYIIADLVGIPDLFKYIKPILKRTFLRHPADARLQILKRWPQRVVAAWVLLVLPALVVQLGIVAVQIPRFLATAWQKVAALAADIAGTSGKELDPLEVVGSSFHIFMLLLPVAGIGLLTVLAAKGTIRMVRRHAEQAGPRHALRGQQARVPHGSMPHRRSVGPHQARHRRSNRPTTPAAASEKKRGRHWPADAAATQRSRRYRRARREIVKSRGRHILH